MEIETRETNPKDTAADRRSGSDRRKRRWPTLQGLVRHRRRSSVRRLSDKGHIVLLDQYTETRLWSVVLVLVLSIADAFLTLILLDNGATELNPLMAFLLSFGPQVFFAVKYLLTACSVVIVVVLNYVFLRHLRIYARDLFKFFAGAFGAVVCWELFLVVRFIL